MHQTSRRFERIESTSAFLYNGKLANCANC